MTNFNKAVYKLAEELIERKPFYIALPSWLVIVSVYSAVALTDKAYYVVFNKHLVR